jgi:hypothetical protein
MQRVLVLGMLTGCALDVPVIEHEIGTLVTGELTPDDFELNDGSVADGYRIFLRRGDEITIVVRATDGMLDPYTFVFEEESRDEIAHDDDSGGGFNSRILLTAPQHGTYGIVITTYETGFHGGTYELETWPGLDPNAH